MKSIELQREALYNEASNYLIQKVGDTGNLVSYADIYVDDKELNNYTAERLAESYLSKRRVRHLGGSRSQRYRYTP